MVNSGSFDSDGYRNGKAQRCTQSSDAATDSQSSEIGDSADAKTDCSKSADTDLPSEASAIEPTPSKTGINGTMSAEASSNDDKATLCCSLPLEKVQSTLTSGSPPPDKPVAEEKPKRTRKLLCLYCDRSFVSANLRQKHVERIHTVKPTRRVSARRQNQLSVTTCVHCDKLNVSEHTLNDLFQHLVQDHPVKYFGCLDCEERFLSSTHLADHNSSHHSAEENVKRHTPSPPQIEEVDVHGPHQDTTDDVPLVKVTRSKLRNKADDPLNVVTNSSLQKRKKSKLKELRNKKISVKTSKIALKRSKRLQAQSKEGDTQKKRRDKKLANVNKSEASNGTKPPDKPKPICINPYPEFDNFYRVKKITDHSIDNLKISSLTFDDVFDKAFFNRIKCNIEENLSHHIDGKLFKNEESESRISNFEKISTNPQEVQTSTSENYGCELSLNAITPAPALSLNSQYGEDFESQIEYGAKPSKKKTQTKSDEVHYKYFTRRKYQASILQQKENRDLSKLDMWTQMVVKERQEKVMNKKKNAKEIQEYTSGQEYKNKLRKEELNRILDRRGPFEDLKEEASKKAAFDKLNSSSDNVSQEVFTDVRAVLNDILNKVFEFVNEDDCLPEIASKEIDDNREIPAFLDLRRKDSSTQEEVDKSDRIALICSSQETENYELPTNAVRGKNELVELTGEWARSRMYICAACGGKFSNMKYLLEHRSIYHQNVWVQSYEFVGNQSELYRHLSIPGLGKVGYFEGIVPCKLWRRSDARTCSKCGKRCNSLGELHRHVLECGGDWTWTLARKKCKYRPFGAKSRRKRRGLVTRIHTKRKTEPSEKKDYKKPMDGPRQRPSDADTIQRMLANLPAKRSRRSLISLRDVVFKSRKTNQRNNTQAVNVKVGKKVCKKQQTEISKPNINQQRNSRSLRSLNKVLSSRILDLNSSLIVKRKLKAIRDQRSTKNNLSTKDVVSKTATKEIENESDDSASLSTQKRKSPKTCTNDDSKTVTRMSVSDKKKTLTKKILNSRLNIKNYFPVKKKSVASTKKTPALVSDPDDSADNNENETVVEPARKSIYLENSQNLKKTKRGGLKGLVRALSLRKRNSKYDEPQEKAASKNLDSANSEQSNNISADSTKKLGRPKTKTVNSSEKDVKVIPNIELSNEPVNVNKGLSKKRKLQRSLRNVINKVKKIKTDKVSHKSEEDAPLKSSSKEIQSRSFLEEKTLRKAIPPEQAATPVEVPEDIPGKEERVHIVADLFDTKESTPPPKIVINSTEDIVQADDDDELYSDKGSADITSTVSVEEPTASTKKDVDCETSDSCLPDLGDKVTPVTIDTTFKPKCVPLVSPNVKGKIRKPNRGLNDCIAMLTNKLHHKDDKISSSLESLFSTSSTTSNDRTDSRILTENTSQPVKQQKAECILKIPTFRASKSPAIGEETALDLSKKSFSSPNLFFPSSSDSGYLESTINKVIEGVIEHNCKEVLTEKFAAPKWSSVDDIIQQVVQNNSSSTVFSKPTNKRNTYTSRTNVDNTIDDVVNSSYNWFEEKTNPFEGKRKLCRKLRRRKDSDDNLIKDIIFGKDKLIIAPSSSLHSALENSLIAKIKENESKTNKISTPSNDNSDKDLGTIMMNNSLSDPQISLVSILSNEPDQSHQTVPQIKELNGNSDISSQTVVEAGKIVSQVLNPVDSDLITDSKGTESQIENYQESNKDGIENIPTVKDEKLHLTSVTSDAVSTTDSIMFKAIENEPCPNSNVIQAIEMPKKGKAKRKCKGKKTQKQNQEKAATNPVLETCIDDCLNIKLISDVEFQPLTSNFPAENSNLGSTNKQVELMPENEPIILETKVVETTSKSLPSDSEDEIPLAVFAKQDENDMMKRGLCKNGNILQISKTSRESSDLKKPQEDTVESLDVATSIPKRLEERILDDEGQNSCDPLNLNKDIVETLTTDSLKENIEQSGNTNGKQRNYISHRNVKSFKTHKMTKSIKRKRRKVVFGRKPINNKRKNESDVNISTEFIESKNDSLELEQDQKMNLNPIPLYTTTSVALDTTEINSLQASKLKLPEEDQSDLPQEAALCNEPVSPSNISTESEKSNCSKETEINRSDKTPINSQRTRRKSKSSKKIDKFDNDLFKDFSLVINKKTKRIPPTNIVDDSVCDDVLDKSMNLLVKSGEICDMKTPEEASEPPLIDSVEEMDMEIEDIPINSSIIERDSLQIISIHSREANSDIVAKVDIQRACTPTNEMESTITRKSPRKKNSPNLNKTLTPSDNIEVNNRGSRRGRRSKTDNTDIDGRKKKVSVDLFKEPSQNEKVKDIKEVPICGLQSIDQQQSGSPFEDTVETENLIEKGINLILEGLAENPIENVSLPIIQTAQENFVPSDQEKLLSSTSTQDLLMKIASEVSTEHIFNKIKEPERNLKRTECLLENAETCQDQKVDETIYPVNSLKTSKRNKKCRNKNALVKNMEPSSEPSEVHILSLKKSQSGNETGNSSREKPNDLETKNSSVYTTSIAIRTDDPKMEDILGNPLEEFASVEESLRSAFQKGAKSFTLETDAAPQTDSPFIITENCDSSINGAENAFERLTPTKRSTRKSKNNKKLSEETKQAIVQPKDDTFPFLKENGKRTRKPKKNGESSKDTIELKLHQNSPFTQTETTSELLETKEATLPSNDAGENIDIWIKPFEEAVSHKRLATNAKDTEKVSQGSPLSINQAILYCEDNYLSETLEVDGCSGGTQNDLITNVEQIKQNIDCSKGEDSSFSKIPKAEDSIRPAAKELRPRNKMPRNAKSNSNSSNEDHKLSVNSETLCLGDQSSFIDEDKASKDDSIINTTPTDTFGELLKDLKTSEKKSGIDKKGAGLNKLVSANAICTEVINIENINQPSFGYNDLNDKVTHGTKTIVDEPRSRRTGSRKSKSSTRSLTETTEDKDVFSSKMEVITNVNRDTEDYSKNPLQEPMYPSKRRSPRKTQNIDKMPGDMVDSEAKTVSRRETIFDMIDVENSTDVYHKPINESTPKKSGTKKSKNKEELPIHKTILDPKNSLDIPVVQAIMENNDVTVDSLNVIKSVKESTANKRCRKLKTSTTESKEISDLSTTQSVSFSGFCADANISENIKEFGPKRGGSRQRNKGKPYPESEETYNSLSEIDDFINLDLDKNYFNSIGDSDDLKLTIGTDNSIAISEIENTVEDSGFLEKSSEESPKKRKTSRGSKGTNQQKTLLQENIDCSEKRFGKQNEKEDDEDIIKRATDIHVENNSSSITRKSRKQEKISGATSPVCKPLKTHSDASATLLDIHIDDKETPNANHLATENICKNSGNELPLSKKTNRGSKENKKLLKGHQIKLSSSQEKSVIDEALIALQAHLDINKAVETTTTENKLKRGRKSKHQQVLNQNPLDSLLSCMDDVIPKTSGDSLLSDSPKVSKETPKGMSKINSDVKINLNQLPEQTSQILQFNVSEQVTNEAFIFEPILLDQGAENRADTVNSIPDENLSKLNKLNSKITAELLHVSSETENININQETLKSRRSRKNINYSEANLDIPAISVANSVEITPIMDTIISTKKNKRLQRSVNVDRKDVNDGVNKEECDDESNISKLNGVISEEYSLEKRTKIYETFGTPVKKDKRQKNNINYGEKRLESFTEKLTPEKDNKTALKSFDGKDRHTQNGKYCDRNVDADDEEHFIAEDMEVNVSKFAAFSEMPTLVVDLEQMDRKYNSLACSNDRAVFCKSLPELNKIDTNVTESKESSKESEIIKQPNTKDVFEAVPLQDASKNIAELNVKVNSVCGRKQNASKISNSDKIDVGTLTKCDTTDKTSKCLNIFDFEDTVTTTQDIIEYKKRTRRSEKCLVTKQIEPPVTPVPEISEEFANPESLGRKRRSRKSVNYSEEKWEHIMENSNPRESTSTQDSETSTTEPAKYVKNHKKRTSKSNKCGDDDATEFLSSRETDSTATCSESPSLITQDRRSRKSIDYEDTLPTTVTAAKDCGLPKNNLEVNNDTFVLEESSKKQKITNKLNSSGEWITMDNSLSEDLKRYSKPRAQAVSHIKIKKIGRKQQQHVYPIEAQCDTSEIHTKDVKIPNSIGSGKTISDANLSYCDKTNKITEAVQPILIKESLDLDFAEINDTSESNNLQNIKESLERSIPNGEISNESLPLSKDMQKLKKPKKNIMDIDVANILDAEISSENRRSSRKKKSLNDDKPVESMECHVDQRHSPIGALKNQLVENKHSLWGSNQNLTIENLSEVSLVKDTVENMERLDDSALYQRDIEPDVASSDSNESIPLLDRMNRLNNSKIELDQYVNSNTGTLLPNSDFITESVPDSVNSSKDYLPIISLGITDDVFKITEKLDENIKDKSVPNSLNGLLPLATSSSMEDLIFESKCDAKLLKSKGKKRKGKKKKYEENLVVSETANTGGNEILTGSSSIVNCNDASGLNEVLPDQKYQLSKITIKNLLLSSLAAPESNNLRLEPESADATNLKEYSSEPKSADDMSVFVNSDTTFGACASKSKDKKGSKSKFVASSRKAFQIFDKTLQENANLRGSKNKYSLGKHLNFTALKKALSTIAKPGKKNKRKKAEVMLSEIKPLTDIITSSEMDIAPVLDEIDKSLESEDIYDFNEDEISEKVIGEKHRRNRPKLRSKSCPKPGMSNNNGLIDNGASADIEQRQKPLAGPTRSVSKRSAKLKALENIQQKTIAEVHCVVPEPVLDTHSRKSRRRSKSLNSSKDDEIHPTSTEDNEFNNGDEKSDTSTATMKNSFSFLKGLSNIDISASENYQTDLLEEGVQIETSSYAQAPECSSDENRILADVLAKGDDFLMHSVISDETKRNINQNNNCQASVESENQLMDCQELRRSRRGSRKVTSYNENDLIDPLIDALENTRNRSARKDKSAEKLVLVNDLPKDLPAEKPKLNSEELFDLLKNSSFENESLNILKPRNSFLENLNKPSSNTDFQDIVDEEFDNIFEKPSLLLAGTEKLKDIDKIYEFIDDIPENTEQVKEFGINKRKLPTNQENMSGESKVNSAFNISVETSRSSYTSREKDSELDKPNYCEICKKTFTRIENLIKHKTTLTHISKLSELEAKEAKERARLENENQKSDKSLDLLMKTSDSKSSDLLMKISDSKSSDLLMKTSDSKSSDLIMKISDSKSSDLIMNISDSKSSDLIINISDSKSSDLLMKTSDLVRDEINLRNILQQSDRTRTATSTPKNSPSLTNHSLNLVDIISDVLNKPVLENFNSEKHVYAERAIQNTDKSDVRRYKSLGERKSFESESQLTRISTPLSETYLPSSMSKTTILENQINLLENIIGNKLESLTANKAATQTNFIDEISSCSNTSNVSAIDNHTCAANKSAFNLITENVQTNLHTAFLKPVQYEEISEDSANVRVYDDSKLRKTLNRDEELFLECCSLLKSGSEVSNSTFSKNLKKPIDHFKESDEPELLENQKLIQTVEEAHEYSDNSRTPTPLGDTYDDDASNSNTISSNWNLKSERPLDKNRSFSFGEVVNKEEAGISFGEILTKGLRNQFEYMPQSDERTNEEWQETRPSGTPVTDDRKYDSDCSSASKKISTKGARKVFEGLKVSIPTEDLNLDLLNNSLISKKAEFKGTPSPNENQTTNNSKPRSTRKSKPVKKSQVGSNLLFKVNKKKSSRQTNNNDLHKKQDVYNFDDTQDNADNFIKPAFKDVKMTAPRGKDKIVAPDSENESLGYADSIGADAKSVSSVSSISAISAKKPEATPENITKKKYKIMGKIFRNAAKCKTDDIDEELRNIPEIPEIDNLELVKNYVRSCQRIKSPFLPPPPPPPLDEAPKKPKMTEEEMNLLFDQLLGKEINESKPEKPIHKLSLVKGKLDSKTGEMKKKLNKFKNRKRARVNSESSDDEFNINKTTKKRTNKKNNQDDSGINLELELKECIGVASRKSQRKCTSGKQNVLVEYWSSDEEAFEAMLNSQKIQARNEEDNKKSEPKVCENEELPEKEVHSETLPVLTEKPLKSKPAKRKTHPSKKSKSLSNKNPETGGMAATASSRRKRAAANPLYHWSSSSEDESQSLIEVKPVREEEDEEDRPVQHGWIVGDSPKKLVTMLALTKGKKTDIDSVKEQGKRRTSNTVS